MIFSLNLPHNSAPSCRLKCRQCFQFCSLYFFYLNLKIIAFLSSLLVEAYGCPEHKHKETDSLETRAVLIEIFMLCWNLSSGSKHRGSLQKKTWLSLKGISYLQVIFVDKKTADMVQFTKRWNCIWIV